MLQTDYQDWEQHFEISCHPACPFKVKPITRSSSSMYGHTEAVLYMSFSPDSLNLASGSGDGTVRLWDTFTQTPLREIKCEDWVMTLSWSPDAEKLAWAEKSGRIQVQTIKG